MRDRPERQIESEDEVELKANHIQSFLGGVGVGGVQRSAPIT